MVNTLQMGPEIIGAWPYLVFCHTYSQVTDVLFARVEGTLVDASLMAV